MSNAFTASFEADPEARAVPRIAVAHRRVEMALELAEAAQRRALAVMEREIAAAEAGVADETETAKGRRDDPMAAAERMARMVRLSLALAARLDSDEPVRRARIRSDKLAEREAVATAEAQARKAREHAELVESALREDIVFEVVEATLKASGLDREAVHERVLDIQERIVEADNEWEYDYDSRPIGAVIARICQDLELTPDWSLWRDEDWAIVEAATGVKGSPFAAGGAAWVRGDGEATDGAPANDLVGALGSSP